MAGGATLPVQHRACGNEQLAPRGIYLSSATKCGRTVLYTASGGGIADIRTTCRIVSISCNQFKKKYSFSTNQSAAWLWDRKMRTFVMLWRLLTTGSDSLMKVWNLKKGSGCSGVGTRPLNLFLIVSSLSSIRPLVRPRPSKRCRIVASGQSKKSTKGTSTSLSITRCQPCEGQLETTSIYQPKAVS